MQIEKGEMIKGALIVFDACLKFCASCTVIDVTNRRIYSTKQWQIQGGGQWGHIPPTNNEMLVQRSRLKFGEHAFSIATMRTCNSLLRATVNTDTFKKKLKMFLFCKCYSIPD